jgi:hypothetical protein
VFENRLLRKIFRPKREEVAEGWRRLHNEALHNLCTSPNIIRMIKLRRMRWVVYVTCIGEMKNSYNILVGKPEGKRPLVRQRCRWEDNIRMDIREIGRQAGWQAIWQAGRQAG